MRIMVTGAAGSYGSRAIRYVRAFAPEAQVVALVRDAAKGAALEAEGFEVRVGDYADADSMRAALEGTERLLFVSSPVPGIQKNVVDAAKAAGVTYIAYTSLHDPQYAKFGLELNHRQTEAWIRESGIPHTFLRNSWYLEIVAPLVGMAMRTGTFPYYAGEAACTWALKREYAEAGARVITGEGYPEALELSGEPVTWREIGEAAARIAGRDVEVRLVDRDEFVRQAIEGGLDQMGLIGGTAYEDYAIAGNNGEAASSSDEFVRVLGHPLATLDEGLRELVG